MAREVLEVSESDTKITLLEKLRKRHGGILPMELLLVPSVTLWTGLPLASEARAVEEKESIFQLLSRQKGLTLYVLVQGSHDPSSTLTTHRLVAPLRDGIPASHVLCVVDHSSSTNQFDRNDESADSGVFLSPVSLSTSGVTLTTTEVEIYQKDPSLQEINSHETSFKESVSETDCEDSQCHVKEPVLTGLYPLARETPYMKHSREIFATTAEKPNASRASSLKRREMVGGDRDDGLLVDEGIEVDKEVVIVKVEGAARHLHTPHTPPLSTPHRHHCVVDCCGLELSNEDLRTLAPHCWLNDQVINGYGRLLMRRYSRVHVMTTFFYSKLSSAGFKGVERWMKKIDVDQLRLLLVPVNISSSHWALAAINFRRKKIEYFDSLSLRDRSVTKRLERFLRHLALRKVGSALRRARRIKRYGGRWKRRPAKGIPMQFNGSDCGVFVCQFAKWLCATRGCQSHSQIPFRQKHMSQIRNCMLQELKSGKILSSLLGQHT